MHLRHLLCFLAGISLINTAPANEKIHVVTFTTVLTEIAQKVGGTRVEVVGLVKAGVDPHEFQPKPGDLLQTARAQLILASGKHLEGYLSKLPESSGSKGTMFAVGDHLPILKMGGDDSVEDPHWWHSIADMKLATALVRDELIKIDPAGTDDFRRNADAYQTSLDDLEQWAKSKVTELPLDKRKLVTTHDAFQYFARDFGFSIHAIEGLNPDDEPSPRKIAEIIGIIRQQHVKAVFGEFGNNPKITASITGESGAKIGGVLYADGLGEGDAATYAGMFRRNLSTIVDGLK